jgi:hypothetical protein
MGSLICPRLSGCFVSLFSSNSGFINWDGGLKVLLNNIYGIKRKIFAENY